MKRISVLQIGKYYYPVKGGIENHLHQLCKELNDRVDLKVVVSNTTNKTEECSVDNVKIKRLSRLFEAFSTPINLGLYKEIRSFEGDIIHLHLPNPWAGFVYLLANPKKKLVIKYHSDIIKQRFLLKFYLPFLKRILKIADKIIATSPGYIESSPVLRRFKGKCVVIPLGVDLKEFKLDDNRETEIKKIKKLHANRKIILFVGRLVYYKGIEYLLKAHKNIDADLIIIGQGPLEKKLKKLSKVLGIGKKVFFYGEVKDLVPYYNACNVFVLPSIERSEAFGIVQLEAMACGKPVVSTRLDSGVPFVNQHKKTGLLVKPKDCEELANAIDFLLKNKDIAKKYSEYAKHRVEGEFTNERNSDSVLKLYNDILDNQI